MAQEGPLERPNGDPAWGSLFSYLGGRQTQHFYQALTAIWLEIEALRLAGASIYDRASEQNQRFDEIEKMPSANGQRFLQRC